MHQLLLCIEVTSFRTVPSLAVGLLTPTHPPQLRTRPSRLEGNDGDASFPPGDGAAEWPADGVQTNVGSLRGSNHHGSRHCGDGYGWPYKIPQWLAKGDETGAVEL